MYLLICLQQVHVLRTEKQETAGERELIIYLKIKEIKETCFQILILQGIPADLLQLSLSVALFLSYHGKVRQITPFYFIKVFHSQIIEDQTCYFFPHIF